MTFETAVEWVIRAIELAGVAVLVSGCLVAAVAYARDLQRSDRIVAYKNLRGNIGRTILLGREILIVADIVLTVARRRRPVAATGCGTADRRRERGQGRR